VSLISLVSYYIIIREEGFRLISDSFFPDGWIRWFPVCGAGVFCRRYMVFMGF
jgi:hypothetical protein